MRLRAVAAALIAALVVGCGDEGGGEGARLTVYLSVPPADRGQALAEGAANALREAGGEAAGIEVELARLEGSSDPVEIAENARDATEDSTSIAYIGDATPEATRTSLPITNEAGMLQISPTAGAPDLLAPFKGSDDVPLETQPSGVRSFGTLAALDGSPRALGRESMALVLDSIERAEDPLVRDSVVDAFFATGDRESPLGHYEFDELGRAARPR
jgi:hypothetical protein